MVQLVEVTGDGQFVCQLGTRPLMRTLGTTEDSKQSVTSVTERLRTELTEETSGGSYRSKHRCWSGVMDDLLSFLKRQSL